MRCLAAGLIAVLMLVGCTGTEPGEGDTSGTAAVSGGGEGNWQAVANPRGNTLEVDLGSLVRRGDTVQVAARVITPNDTIPRAWQIACESRTATREGGSGWAPIRPESLVGMLVEVACEDRPGQ